MDKGAVEKYEQGIALFEEGYYEEAVACLIDAYEGGYMKSEIIQDVYSCFITPNIQEFQDNYAVTGVEEYGVKCEDTMIDFIPVDEYKFHLWHKKREKFLGLLDVWNIKKPESKSFQSLFMADDGNIEEKLRLLTLKSWNNVYVLLNGEESELLSFCKLPLFFQQYLKDAVFFKSEEELKSFFQNSENYLPKEVCACNAQYYNDLFEEIHNERIRKVGGDRNNIFLSICIPTWNRGLSALNVVKHILAVSYDAELEVVVSNNGSDKTEGYDELKQIRDSRLKYFEFDSNKGFACNFRNVLGMAGGMFAVTCSDEDLMNVNELSNYLDFLLNNADVRFLTTSGVGPNFNSGESCIYESGFDSCVHAINTNYITGATFNIQYMRENKIFEKYDALSGLAFIYWYAQCVMAVVTTMGGKAGFTNIVLWQEGGVDNETGMLKYMRLENRIEQQNDAVEFCNMVFGNDMKLFLLMMIERMSKTYFLLNVGFYCLPKEFMSEYKWLDVCLTIYESQLELIDKYSGGQKAIIKTLKGIIFEEFKDNVLDNPVKDYQTEEEGLIQEKAALVILEKIKQGIRPEEISTKEIEETVKAGL